jgi:two-component system, cell cycle sensor histidine kinase and response regulator CckA
VLSAIREGKLYRGEFRALRADTGEERWVRAVIQTILDPSGRPGYFLGVHIDVTEEKRAADRLRQAQKMEAIGNLTGGMAHDFNNLLGVIIGNLELTARFVADDAETKQLVQEAVDAAVSGAELTRRLLAFARQQPLRPQRIEANEVVTDIVRLLRRTLGENIEISLDLADDLWPVVADPVQLEAGLANLATNARDAMPRGGRLTMATGNRQLDADYAAAHAEVTPGDYAAIEVTDSGSGMAPEIVDRIFEPFFTTKAPGKGTGLGLSMVFGYIKQSGGHIAVYSEPGVGTTFRLYLPRAVSEVEPAREAIETAAPSRGAGETVLAVEDNERLRRLVVRQLSGLGYRPIAAVNAAEALSILEREPVDVLFSDIVMPGLLDGIGLAQQVRDRWPAVKVVLTSGFPGTDQLGRQDVAVRILTKPYRSEDLGAALHEVLAG